MTWLALMVLLAVNIGIAYVPAGDLTFSLNLAVAAAMVALIGWFFMDLSKASALNRMIAISGFLWVGILFLITFADYLTRP
jgi:cytochrome c oxidase subunit 4